MTVFIQILTSIATLIVSIAAIILSAMVSKNTQKVSLVAQKRSKRIDDLRAYSSDIVSAALCRAKERGNEVDLDSKIIIGVARFTSLLQYVYPRDIELIDLAHAIQENAIKGNENLEHDAYYFWKKVDLYIGTEYERLKKESEGVMPESGNVSESLNSFDSIYDSLQTASQQFDSIKKI